MTLAQPATHLDARYSDGAAIATAWDEAVDHLERAGIYWLSTTRPDGRPHVTPLIAVWREGALHFCTGEAERKARNLEENSHCILTTGCNDYGSGLDVVVEGEAARITDNAALGVIAAAYEAKYGPEWHFDVVDGAFGSEGNQALVFRVVPSVAFGFRRGDLPSQTRWSF